MSMNDYDMSTIQYEPVFPEVIIAEEDGYDNCSGDPLEISANNNYEHYLWFKDDVLIPNETGTTITATEFGTYKAIGLQGQKMIESNEFVFIKAQKPSIAIQNNQIDVTPTTGAFEWLVNGTAINETGTDIEPTFSGFYQVRRTDNNGCVLTSDSTYFFVPQDLNVDGIKGWNVQYQPNGNTIEVALESNKMLQLNLNVYNALGQRMSHQVISANGFQNVSIENQNWGTGIYFVSIENGKKQDTIKLYIP